MVNFIRLSRFLLRMKIKVPKKIVRKYVSIALGALIELNAFLPKTSAELFAQVQNMESKVINGTSLSGSEESKFLFSYEDGMRIKAKTHPAVEEGTPVSKASFNTEFKFKPKGDISLIDLGINMDFKSKLPNLSNYATLGFLLDDENKSKAAVLLKAGYGNRFSLSKNGRQLLNNDAQIKAGVLFSKNKIKDRERPTQLLLGLKDRIGVPILVGRTSLDAVLGAELIGASSEKGSGLSIDSYATNAVLDHTSNLSKKIIWHNKLSHNAISLNKNRYFFVDKQIEQKATTALGYDGNKFKIIGLFTAENRKDDDNIMKTRAGLKIALSDWLLKSYIEKGIVNNKAKSNQYFVSLQKKFNKFALELFYSQKKSKKPWLSEDDNFVGFVLGFDLGKSPNITKLMEDDLSNYEKDNFYNLTAYKDYDLSFKENVEQLNNIRKLNEWISNIDYKSEEGWEVRTPFRVYSKRGGDCDEQANLFSYIAKQHGYKAHILDYSVGEEGHGIALFEDKKGNTFVAEYGEVYKINVDKNASLEEKAKTALNQCGSALAIVPSENEKMYFFVFEPSKEANSDYFCTTSDYRYGHMTFKEEKPKTERGVRIFINDYFFK